MNDQDFWQTPEIKLLGGLLMFLTIWTIPSVICSQLLTAGVQFQTFTQFYHLKIVEMSKFQDSNQKYSLPASWELLSHARIRPD